MVEQLTFNQLVGGSSPPRSTNFNINTGGWCTGSIRLSKSLGVGSIPTPPANVRDERWGRPLNKQIPSLIGVWYNGIMVGSNPSDVGSIPTALANFSKETAPLLDRGWSTERLSCIG